MRFLCLLVTLCLLEGPHAFSPPGAIGLRRGGAPSARGGGARGPRLAPRLAAGEGGGAAEGGYPPAGFSSLPPGIDPSVFLPPGLAPPGKSRYEGFYASEGEAIDVDSEQAGEAEVAGNPFFVGYSPDELGFIWDVHLSTVGERNHEEEEQEKSDALPGMLGGGLHDLIMNACNEADKEKQKKEGGGSD